MALLVWQVGMGAFDDTTGNVQILIEMAESFRRVASNEEFDAKGVRAIWHRGRYRSEMLSWENRAGNIVRQELAFFGMMVEFRAEGGVRTGTVPDAQDTTGVGRVATAMVKFEPVPNLESLNYASALLKNMPNRDFYAQHLLKAINDTVSSAGLDDNRTMVRSLESFTKNLKVPEEPKPTPWFRRKLVLLGLLVLGVAVVGFIVGFLL